MPLGCHITAMSLSRWMRPVLVAVYIRDFPVDLMYQGGAGVPEAVDDVKVLRLKKGLNIWQTSSLSVA